MRTCRALHAVRQLGACLALVIAATTLFAACGKEIGDPCTFSTDCSPNGDRQCDFISAGGYCTIQGCDISTCPDEAVCVQFFHGNFSNVTCDPLNEPDVCDPTSRTCCSPDELCSVSGHCVPRSSEARFCMRKCGSNGDCRDGYECRGLEQMIAHGGQPVLPPGEAVSESSPKFCAQAVP